MAKAVPAPAPRPRLPAQQLGRERGSLGEYFRGVWEELKKVQWPTRTELWRMTGVVIATVILFAVLIGGADYILGLGVKQLYSSTTTSTNTTTTLPSTTPRTIPRTVPPVVPTAPGTHATPVP